MSAGINSPAQGKLSARTPLRRRARASARADDQGWTGAHAATSSGPLGHPDQDRRSWARPGVIHIN